MKYMQDHHILHYLLLLLGFSVAAFLFVLFEYDRTAQILVAGLSALYYTAWGIVHHAVEDRLNKLTVLEYVLFGSLAFLLIFTVLCA